jgi:hypothetical protein
VQAGVNQLSEKVDLLLARLRIAAAADKRTQRNARIFGVLTILLIVAFVGACDLLVDGVAPLALPYKLLAMSALIVLVVLVARRWHRYRRQDLDDRKLQTVQKVLGILRADIPRDSAVALTVDLRGYKVGGTEAGRKGAVTLYRHAWLTLTVPLADGNTITLEVTDRVKRKVKRKKSREQCRSAVDLGLRLDKRYGDAADAVRRLRRLPVPKSLGLVTVTDGPKTDGRARRLSARFATPVTLSDSQLVAGDALLAAVRWAYVGLTPTGRSA